MRDRQYLLPVFLICCLGVLFIFLLGRIGFLSFFQNSVQDFFFSIGGNFIHTSSQNKQVEKLQQENLILTEKIAQMDSLQSDNKALRDQFQTTSPSSQRLLPATVVGMPGSIPNVSFPETYIINKGRSDGVQVGMGVVIDNFLIGSITQTMDHFSEVRLVINKVTSLSVRDSTTNAIGVVKGQGNGTMLLDNVLLSDSLHINDFVVTMGSQTTSGIGLPPNLIIGKIVNVSKNPSSLFQTADIAPVVALDSVSTVFVLVD